MKLKNQHQAENTISNQQPSGAIQKKANNTDNGSLSQFHKTPQSQLSPYQSKEGQKPPIQANQSHISAKQQPVQRQKNNHDLKSQMGNQYGVDLSGFKEHKDSAFPGSVGALATIQGKDIHYAPGQFTENNRKHELGHAIDNTLNGTPKGDKVVNGQSIDTTREKVADKIAETPLQRKTESGSGDLSKPLTSGVVQRATYGKADPNQKYKDRKYKRVKNNKQDKGNKVGMKDEKMQVLQEFAYDLQTQIEKETKHQIGPHLAVSVLHKHLYVAINTTIKGDSPVPTDILEAHALKLVKIWEKALPKDKKNDSAFTHGVRWLVTAGLQTIKGFGRQDEIDNRSLHGEMRILKHLDESGKLDNLKAKHQRTDGFKKVIRLGGTQLDCSDCHQTEHGGSNGTKHSENNRNFGGIQSYDDKFDAKGYQIMSPGTHGNSFPGWVHPMTLDRTYGGKQDGVLNPTFNNQYLGKRNGKDIGEYMIYTKKFEQKQILERQVRTLSSELGLQTKAPKQKRKQNIDDDIKSLTQRVVWLEQNVNNKEKDILKWQKEIGVLEQAVGIKVKPKKGKLIDRHKACYKRKNDLRTQKIRFEKLLRKVKSRLDSQDVVNNKADLKTQLATALPLIIPKVRQEVVHNNNDLHDQRVKFDKVSREANNMAHITSHLESQNSQKIEKQIAKLRDMLSRNHKDDPNGHKASNKFLLREIKGLLQVLRDKTQFPQRNQQKQLELAHETNQLQIAERLFLRSHELLSDCEKTLNEVN